MRENFRSYHLAVAFYRLVRTLQLPRHLKEQLDRAASSVALNLAEGAGRQSKNDQRRFFAIAFGSLRECQAILDLSSAESTSALECADILAAHVYRLMKGCGG
jgi:four helix bundle protein